MARIGIGIGLGVGDAPVAPPTISAISPHFGPSAGGTIVAVTGTNIVTLTFGGIAATNNNDGTWTTGNGASSVGGDVVATDGSGSTVLAGAWTYLTGQLGGAKSMGNDILLGDL